MSKITSHKKLKNSVPKIFKSLKRISILEPEEELSVVLILRPNEKSAIHDNDAPIFLPKKQRKNWNRQEIIDAHAARPGDIKLVKKFLEKEGIHIESIDPKTRAIEIKDTTKKFAKLFNVKLGVYQHHDDLIIGHNENVHLPKHLRDIVTDVIGFNTLPFRHHSLSREVKTRGVSKIAPGIIVNDSDSDQFGEIGAIGFSANHWANFYNYPKELNGKGQCVGIIALGGGYTKKQMKTYFRNIKIPLPDISFVEVNATNNPGENPMLDGEVATDVQTFGAAAPKAKIVVYFAKNNSLGMWKGINAALNDAINQPNIISISYGSPEGASGNSDAEIKSINQLFKLATLLDITVVASSGDTGSTLGSDQLEVEFPASSPFVLSCGGTGATISPDYKKITREKVWNQVWHFMGSSQRLATGGGFSKMFKRPAFQKGQVPRDVYPRQYRGVPDVAASANPSQYGYYVRTTYDAIVGGTSAAAPLWAALIARLNQKTGPLGFINPDLYQVATQSPATFKVIKNGNNSINRKVDEWHARRNGWDPCTGLGCPDGEALLLALEKLNKEEKDNGTV